MPNFVLAYGIRPPAGEAKKYKKELSSDAIALSGGFFYPELRSTIVRRALSPFALLVIKGVLKALPSREWYGRPCRQSSPSPIHYEFFIFQLGQSKISFNPRTTCRQASLRAFVYAVLDARGSGALCLRRGLFILWRQLAARMSASNMEVNSSYHPLRIGLLS